MYITPIVKHPLVRNPIRPDVYNKAAQLQILDIPGSKLEDRQYEFSLKNISVATGNWKDILYLMKVFFFFNIFLFDFIIPLTYFLEF